MCIISILNQQIYTYLTGLHSNHGRMLDTPHQTLGRVLEEGMQFLA
jgi:hypothetical protein